MISAATTTALSDKRMSSSQLKQLKPCPEEYAALLLHLHQAREDEYRLCPTVGITSSLHGEGVTTIATNLAIYAAQALLRPVLLIATTNGPRCIEKMFSLEAAEGMSDLLTRSCTISDCVHETGQSNLFVMGAGARNKFGIAFHPQPISRLLGELRGQFPFIVVDLPPVEQTSTCLAVASQLDGVLLAVESERAASRDVLRTSEQLDNIGARLLGVVLNKQRRHSPFWSPVRRLLRRPR